MQKGQSCSTCMHWYDSLNQCRRHAPEGAQRAGTGHVDPLWPHTNPEQWCGDWTGEKAPDQGPVQTFGFRTQSALLFDLFGPEGQRWRLWEDGTCEGFPPKMLIANLAKPLLDAMRSEIQTLRARR